MADQDGYIQVAVDGVGKKVDNSELTHEPSLTGYTATASGDTIYRQRVILASDLNPRQRVLVDGEEGHGYLLMDSRSFDRLEERLIELTDLMKMFLEQ